MGSDQFDPVGQSHFADEQPPGDLLLQALRQSAGVLRKRQKMRRGV